MSAIIDEVLVIEGKSIDFEIDNEGMMSTLDEKRQTLEGIRRISKIWEGAQPIARVKLKL